MTSDSPELIFLKDEVAKAFGSRLETSTDFEALSAAIETRIGALISVSTLKRLWGYIQPQGKPRMSTLDLLSQYTGRASYATLCAELRDTSGFIYEKHIDCASLQQGAEVVLQWMPDRAVCVKYLGDKRFRVIDGGRSKLREGDEFEAFSFLLGHPLYIDAIIRNGSVLPPYIAGRSGGLTGIAIR
ncbi:MAG: hypothetical protein J5533_01650 [Bacteroidales bacterium]|nr:hypothetical protein [Bacteroidales bacterium]